MRFQWITNIPFWRGPRRRKGIVVVRFGWTWTCLDPVGKSNNRAPECWSKFLVNRRITFSIMDENEAIKWISSPPSSPVLVPDKQFQFTHCQWGNLTMDHIIHKIRIIFIFDYHNFGNWIEFFIANLYLSPTYIYPTTLSWPFRGYPIVLPFSIITSLQKNIYGSDSLCRL